MWNGQQFNRIVVVGSGHQGHHEDPETTAIPLVPEDSYECLQFRDDVAISLTTQGHFHVSVSRSAYVAKDTLTTLSSNVTAAHFTGTILTLGTDKGNVYLYAMKKASDLLQLDLDKWVWRAREGGRHEVMAVEAMVASPTLGVNVFVMKRYGLYGLHVAHKTFLDKQKEEDME